MKNITARVLLVATLLCMCTACKKDKKIVEDKEAETKETSSSSSTEDKPGKINEGTYTEVNGVLISDLDENMITEKQELYNKNNIIITADYILRHDDSLNSVDVIGSITNDNDKGIQCIVRAAIDGVMAADYMRYEGHVWGKDTANISIPSIMNTAIMGIDTDNIHEVDLILTLKSDEDIIEDNTVLKIKTEKYDEENEKNNRIADYIDKPIYESNNIDIGFEIATSEYGDLEPVTYVDNKSNSLIGVDTYIKSIDGVSIEELIGNDTISYTIGYIPKGYKGYGVSSGISPELVNAIKSAQEVEVYFEIFDGEAWQKYEKNILKTTDTITCKLD